MALHHLIFVRVGPSSFAADPRYFGMNSEGLPYPSVFSEDLETRCKDLEENSEGKLHQAELLFHALQAEDKLEIAMLLTCDPQRPNWAFIGYDVGERIDGHWSAIRWMGDFWLAVEQARWIEGFNENGLIRDAAIAEAFLEAYLGSGDSVLSDDREENLALYGFFPIWRYFPPWNWAKDAKVKGLIYDMANSKGLRIDWQDFPSGFAMVDVWVGEGLVVIQLGPGLLGLSLVLPGGADFEVRPDEVFEDFEGFERALVAAIR